MAGALAETSTSSFAGLHELLTATGNRKPPVVVDLSATTDFDAELTETLLELQRLGRRRGWRLAVVRPAAAPAWELFQSVALDLTIRVFETRTAALAWARTDVDA